MESSESNLLQLCKRSSRPRVMQQIISGKRKYEWVEKDRIVVNWECNDKRLHTMMDDLYTVYRLDPTTINGMAMMPLISTLRYNNKLEFHIYFVNKVVVSFMIYNFIEYSDVKKAMHTISFVWMVPKFRGQGLFKKMYSDLEKDKGSPIFADQPNDACKKALEKFGYSQNRVIEHYNT